MPSTFSSLRNPERDIDVEIPGLADETGGIGLRIQHGGQARIVGGAAPGALGHAEGDEHRVFERRRRGEELRVGRVGARPAAFDVIDAQRVERERDLALVLDGEIHALRLRAVAQRGVEEIEALARHCSLLLCTDASGFSIEVLPSHSPFISTVLRRTAA